MFFFISSHLPSGVSFPSGHGSWSTKVINASRSPLLSLGVREEVSAVTATTWSLSCSTSTEPPDLPRPSLPPTPNYPGAFKGIFQNQHDCFKNIRTYLFWSRDSEMPGVVLRTLAAQSPSCWSALVSCCESMPCAPDSCTKTNLVDFHNYYNLIINPLVWTPHRTAWQRSHASCWEM